MYSGTATCQVEGSSGRGKPHRMPADLKMHCRSMRTKYAGTPRQSRNKCQHQESYTNNRYT
jgi:hypothetical protein